MDRKSDEPSLASKIIISVLLLTAVFVIWLTRDAGISFLTLGGIAFIIFIFTLIDLIRKKPEKPNLAAVIIPLLVFFIPTSLGLLLMFSPAFKEWFRGGWLIILSVILFVTGILLVTASIRKFLTRKKHCTYTVDAVCVAVNESYDIQMDSRFYTPVWEFSINGETKRAVNDFYTSGKVSVGDHVILHVDPDNVNTHYQNRLFDGSCILLMSFGAGFTGLSILGIILYAILKAAGVF